MIGPIQGTVTHDSPVAGPTQHRAGQPDFVEWLAPGGRQRPAGQMPAAHHQGLEGDRLMPAPAALSFHVGLAVPSAARLPQNLPGAIEPSAPLDGVLSPTPQVSSLAQLDAGPCVSARPLRAPVSLSWREVGATGGRPRCFEIVASPWKLVSTGLDQVHLFEAVPKPGPYSPQTHSKAPMPALLLGSVATTTHMAAMAHVWYGTMPIPVAAGAPVAVAMETPAASDTAGARALAHLPAGAVLASPFPARLLRQLESLDGSSTVWVRDYRIDGGHAALLVPLIRDAARHTGAIIARIVVNGRTLWDRTTLTGQGTRHAG